MDCRQSMVFECLAVPEICQRRAAEQAHASDQPLSSQHSRLLPGSCRVFTRLLLCAHVLCLLSVLCGMAAAAQPDDEGQVQRMGICPAC